MDSHPKLTKKQKKSLAFRTKSFGKGKSKNPEQEEEEDAFHSLPETDLILDSSEDISPIPQPVEKNKPSKKRKREDTDADGGSLDHSDSPEEVSPTQQQQEKRPPRKKKKELQNAWTEQPAKQRYILFLGNLKYTTTADSIKSHFSQCDPPPTVRLLSPKSTSGKPTTKSKGCAFLEFSHSNALQQALKLHHSTLEGRVINVELTAGGGGKGESRLHKVAERNKTLASQRLKKQTTQKQGEAATSGKGERYSRTSGAEHVPEGPKTWSVGNEEDTNERHRGGKKHKKASRLKPKLHGTGMNAIPLGSAK